MDRNEVMTKLKAYICSELLNNADYPITDRPTADHWRVNGFLFACTDWCIC